MLAVGKGDLDFLAVRVACSCTPHRTLVGAIGKLVPVLASGLEPARREVDRMGLGRRCRDNLVDDDVPQPRVAREPDTYHRRLRCHTAAVQRIGREARPEDHLVGARRA